MSVLGLNDRYDVRDRTSLMVDKKSHTGFAFRLVYTNLPSVYASVNWVSIGSDNCLSPGRRQAIIWTNDNILSTRLQGTYFKEILFEIQIFSFHKMRFNMLCPKWWPSCPGGRWVNCGVVMAVFTLNLQGYFIGTWAIMWLPHCRWSKPEGHG